MLQKCRMKGLQDSFMSAKASTMTTHTCESTAHFTLYHIKLSVHADSDARSNIISVKMQSYLQGTKAHLLLCLMACPAV